MGKMKRDYSGVEQKERLSDYEGDEPKRGIYNGKLVSVADHTAESSGNEGTKWIFAITDEPYDGWIGSVYTNDTSTAWKEAEIMVALGLIPDINASINTTHEKILKTAKPVRLRIRNEEYDGETRGKVGRVMSASESTKGSKGSSDKASSKSSSKGSKGKKKKGDEPPF